MATGIRTVSTIRFESDRRTPDVDSVVVEEPLEIRLGEEPVVVTMRTPGHDAELALGFLITEGVVRDPDAVLAVASCPDDPNVVEVRVDLEGPGIETPRPRRFYATSSCGVCGKESIDALRVRTDPLRQVDAPIQRTVLTSLPSRLRKMQELFDATGALHAAGLFDLSGELLCAREDVGRHNAVDKVIGWAAARDLVPLHGSVLLVSGRASFEIVQKAWVAGIPIVAAVSGPSSLAVELAQEAGLTLIAFLRDDQMNVYSEERRVR